MSSFTSACSSIDFGFSQCFGGWQNASVEVKLSAGQSFPATATGMDVTESVSDLASKTFILTGATGTLGRACAKILRARGCKLIFASRDVEKASAFVGEMEKEDFEGESHVISADSCFTLGGIHIRTLLQFHGRVTSLGFVFDGRFGYSTDVVDMPEEAFAHLTGLDFWIVEMLRDEPHQAHAHFDLTMDWIKRCQPKRAALTHLGLESDYQTLLAKCPDGVEPGYDGLSITL